MTVTSLDLSLGEFRALVAKAARGAGFSWGLADDLAYSAKRLAEFGVPSGAMAVRLLERIDGVDLNKVMPANGFEPTGDVLCPVCTGAYVADVGMGVADGESLRITALTEPALLGPLLATAQQTGKLSCVVSWDGGECIASSESVVLVGSAPPQATVTVRWVATTSAAATREHRVLLEPAIIERLGEFAHRTYAPNTEASREAGAGAGLLDDD